MMLGRVGVMAMYAKKYHDQKGKPKHQYLLDHQEKFKKCMKSKAIFAHSSWPKAAWFLGFLFILAGITLFVFLVKARKENITIWWRLAIIFGMILLGYLFLVSSEIVKVELHKVHKFLIVERLNPFWFCRKLRTIRDLEQLESISIVKQGHQAYQTSTIFYSIQFQFKEGREDVMEFSELREAKLKYTEIITFLERDSDLGKIDVEDKSTHYKLKPRLEEQEDKEKARLLKVHQKTN